MSSVYTDLLRESVDRLTQDERLPADLADRVFRRDRQRRLALRAAAAAGTAAIAAAGVLAAVALPGAAPSGEQADQARQAPVGHTPAAPAAQTAAYVFSHTERALAAARRENLVEEIHTVGHHYGLGLTQVITYHLNGDTVHVIEQAGPTASQANTWSYRGQLREQGLDAAGKPVFDATSTTVQSPSVLSVNGMGVDYTSRTWWEATVRLKLPATTGQSACQSAYLPPPVGTAVDWPAEIRAALSCGHYRLAGHDQVGTVRAIKLVSEKVNGPYTETLWVDPSSYLPVRLTWHWLDHRAQGPGTLTGDFRWVRPTEANLGALRVTVPGGFRRDRAGGLPVPGMNL